MSLHKKQRKFLKMHNWLELLFVLTLATQNLWQQIQRRRKETKMLTETCWESSWKGLSGHHCIGQRSPLSTQRQNPWSKARYHSYCHTKFLVFLWAKIKLTSGQTGGICHKLLWNTCWKWKKILVWTMLLLVDSGQTAPPWILFCKNLEQRADPCWKSEKSGAVLHLMLTSRMFIFSFSPWHGYKVFFWWNSKTLIKDFSKKLKTLIKVFEKQAKNLN